MSRNEMLRALAGIGALLFFLWFIGLSAVSESCFYLETGLRIAISLLMAGIGAAFRYVSLRIRRLEQQMKYLLDHCGQNNSHRT